MTAKEVREKYINFFTSFPRNHKEIPPAPLVLEDDPTTLFTSSGMQPLVPYLMGEPHPSASKRLVDSQPSIRTVDIEEVGDYSHLTFFEMLGNWSLGDYFKADQIPWIFEFFTKKLGLDKDKLWVSVFEGDSRVAKDEESYNLWKNLGVAEDRIRFYGVDKNWWSRSGTPEQMPVGEIGGPDSEIFYDFGEELKIHENSLFKNDDCHPNCRCGRFLEIGNCVFIQYKKAGEGKLEELPQKNVDFGGGLERITAAVKGEPDIFKIDLFSEALKVLEAINKSNLRYDKNPSSFRIILDHLRASAFLINSNIIPSNKEQGYVLRRLIRRAMVASRKLGMEGDEWLSNALPSLIAPYKKTYPDLLKNNPQISEIITREVDQFRKTIKNGLDNVEKVEETAKNLYKLSSLVTTELDWLGNLQSIMDFLIRNQFPRNIKLLFNNKELINTYLIKEQREKLNELMKIVIHAGLSTSYLLKEQEKENFNPSMEDLKKIIGVLNYFKDHKIKLNSEWAFKYITTYGVPLEILQELAEERNIDVDVSNLDRLNREHQELSRTTSAGVFRGGLANHSPEVIKLHTATHLLLSTLRKILGDHVVQKGQNITSERSRFDFPNPEKLTNEQIKKVENNVNEIISKDLPVNFIVMPKDEALNTGAIHAFNEKYADTVKVYFVGKSLEDAVSREFCGGPHVSHTGEIGHVRIKKQEKIGSGLIRIYMVLTN